MSDPAWSTSTRHLDTDIVVAFLRGDLRVSERLRAHADQIAVSALVAGELLYGARTSARPDENLEALDRFFQVVPVVPFDRAAAEAYSRIRLGLRRIGRPAGEIDTLVAAVALAHGATLVTHNTRHFQHIPDLRSEDWLA